MPIPTSSSSWPLNWRWLRCHDFQRTVWCVNCFGWLSTRWYGCVLSDFSLDGMYLKQELAVVFWNANKWKTEGKYCQPEWCPVVSSERVEVQYRKKDWFNQSTGCWAGPSCKQFLLRCRKDVYSWQSPLKMYLLSWKLPSWEALSFLFFLHAFTT